MARSGRRRATGSDASGGFLVDEPGTAARFPLEQIGHSEIRLEGPILKRRDRTPRPSRFRSDLNEATQPPEVSKEIKTALQPLIASLPAGYRIELGGSIEEATKANDALATIFFPAMIAAMLIVVMLQVRSFSTMAMVMLTAPLGLVGGRADVAHL